MIQAGRLTRGHGSEAMRWATLLTMELGSTAIGAASIYLPATVVLAIRRVLSILFAWDPTPSPTAFILAGIAGVAGFYLRYSRYGPWPAQGHESTFLRRLLSALRLFASVLLVPTGLLLAISAAPHGAGVWGLLGAVGSALVAVLAGLVLVQLKKR